MNDYIKLAATLNIKFETFYQLLNNFILIAISVSMILELIWKWLSIKHLIKYLITIAM
jgi:hypothetical protein